MSGSIRSGRRGRRTLPATVWRFLAVGLTALLVAGCGGSPAASVSAGQSTAATIAASSSATAERTSAAATASATTQAPRSAACGSQGTAPAAASGEAGVSIHHDPGAGIDAQVELSASGAPRILIDVAYPDMLSAPATSTDVLLTTHEHPDHYDVDFLASYPGRKLPEGGSATYPGVKITGIDAAHGMESGPAIGPDGSNFLYVVEMGGLRIGHFGDLGQTALTRAQLDAIGRLDVLFTQFDNPYSSADLSNHIGFDVINQVCPRIVIPTHMLTDSTADMNVAMGLWKTMYSPNASIHVTPSTLPAETTVLVMGFRGSSMGKSLNLPPAPW